MSATVGHCRSSDGVRIAFAVSGEGPPLVRVACWLTHLEQDWRSPLWRPLLDALSERFRLVRFDPRGTGLSQREVDSLAPAATVGDLEAVVAELGLDRFHLLAWSSGCAAAVEYAVRHPERVVRLVVIGGAVRGWGRRASPDEVARHERLLELMPEGWGAAGTPFQEPWCSLYAPGGGPDLVTAWAELQRVSSSPRAAASILRASGEIDLGERLRSVRTPTLALHARGDLVAPFDEGRELARRLPDARLVPLESRHHLPAEGDPAWPELGRELLGFLGAGAFPAAEGARVDLASRLVTGGALRGPFLDELRSDLDLETDGESDDRDLFDDTLLGETVGRYRLTGRLGVGGMGVVYRAVDTRLEREVAVKLLPADQARDPLALERFEREARAVSGLNHPSICVLHEVGEHDGRPYLVLELLEGESLDRVMAEGPMAPERALEVAAQVAAGLEAAHEAGILHRDIKPGNLLVTRRGHVKILDFGIAKLVPMGRDAEGGASEAREQLALTRPGTAPGTVAYMSPEQVVGEELDGRSDVFSLGAVLYEMLSGRRAFGGATAGAIISSVLAQDPPPLTEVGLDPEVQGVVSRALAKDRRRRWPGAGPFREELLRLRLALLAGSSGGADGASRRSARRRLQVELAILGVLLGVVLALLLGRGGPSGPSSEGAGQRTVAVLPFADLSSEPVDRYLALSVPDEVTNVLARSHELAVRPFSETRRVDPSSVDPKRLGRELGADLLVTGQLYLREGELSLTLEAIEASAARVVWRESLTHPSADLIELRRVLAERVRRGLLRELGAAAGEPGSAPSSSEAYRLYLEAVPMLNDPQPNREAIAKLERSAALDPTFAPTWSQLGRRLYTGFYYWDGGPSDGEAARQAIERALELDPDLLDAVGSLVELEVEEGDVEGAIEAVGRFLAHRPRSGYGHSLASIALRYGGLIDEAVEACERGIALDPRDPRLRVCTWAFLWSGDYPRTLELASRATSLLWSNDLTARIALMEGRPEEALRLWSRQVDPSAGRLRRDALVSCLEGERGPDLDGRFREELELLLGLQDPEWKFVSAGLFVHCGHVDEGLLLLRQAAEGGYCVDPSSDPLLAPLAGREELAEVQAVAGACRDRVRRAVEPFIEAWRQTG